MIIISGGRVVVRPTSVAPRILCALGMALLLSLSTACASTEQPAACASTEQWSMGYYTPWGKTLPISRIDWSALSHAIYGFAVVRSDGSLDLDSVSLAENAAQFVSAARAAGVRPMFSLAQAWWSGDQESFELAATYNRETLVSNVIDVVDTYGFDGVDIDWEPFDAGTQGQVLLSLAADLRARLGTTKLLTIAVSYYQSDYAYWGRAHAYFDRLSIMTYDMSGTWDPYTWYNSALYDPEGRVWSVNLAVERFTLAGVPAATTNIGIPFYGYVWSGATGPYQSVDGASTQQSYYQDLAVDYDLRSALWDDVAQVPYLTGHSFISFDNERSVTAKVDYAVKRGLGGWIIWELSADYLADGIPANPLLAAIKKAWRRPDRPACS